MLFSCFAWFCVFILHLKELMLEMTMVMFLQIAPFLVKIVKCVTLIAGNDDRVERTCKLSVCSLLVNYCSIVFFFFEKKKVYFIYFLVFYSLFMAEAN